MKELKVGERVTITLEVVEHNNGCIGCFYHIFGRCSVNGELKCSIYTRSDGKDIIFKKVKE